MPLNRLARELEETASQTSGMLDPIARALDLLRSAQGNTGAGLPADTARAAATLIVTALQSQDRIEQRCRNMAHAVRQFALLPMGATTEVYDEIWSNLMLDELRLPALSGTAPRPSDPHGEIEFF